MLLQQASMVSFVMLFRLLGVVFLVMLPLVLLMKRPRGSSGQVGLIDPGVRSRSTVSPRRNLSAWTQYHSRTAVATQRSE